MGVLYAKVAGQWVPIAPAGTVAPPAYAGPRSDLSSDARFSHLSLASNLGFMARSDGSMLAQIKSGTRFYVWDDVAGTFVQMSPSFSTINGWGIGTHATYGSNYDVLWSEQVRNTVFGGAYGLMIQRNNGNTYLNGHSNIYVRTGNVDRMIVTGDTVQANATKFEALYNAPNFNWNTSHFLGNSTAGAGEQTRIALNSPGVAPIMRATAVEGEKMSFTNNPGSALVPIRALAFEVNSTITSKRDVRSLCTRERIVVRHDSGADIAPTPDVMSLRPVAFRPKVPAMRLVPTDGVSYTTDPDTWRSEPEVGILGHEGTRERLGLIAEEVETVIPSAVTHNIYGETLGIDYAQITVALLDHVQRLTDEVATLRYRLTELEGTTA